MICCEGRSQSSPASKAMNRVLLFLGHVVTPVALAACALVTVKMVITPKGDPADAGPKPRLAASGLYQCVENSIRSGQVTELTLPGTKVLSWGIPEAEWHEGWRYWAIRVDYTVGTYFGNDQTAARALIRQQRVHAWKYIGSDELVP